MIDFLIGTAILVSVLFLVFRVGIYPILLDWRKEANKKKRRMRRIVTKKEKMERSRQLDVEFIELADQSGWY